MTPHPTASPSRRTLRALLDHLRDCPRCKAPGLQDELPHPLCPVGRVLLELRKAWLRLEAAEASGRATARASRLHSR